MAVFLSTWWSYHYLMLSTFQYTYIRCKLAFIGRCAVKNQCKSKANDKINILLLTQKAWNFLYFNTQPKRVWNEKKLYLSSLSILRLIFFDCYLCEFFWKYFSRRCFFFELPVAFSLKIQIMVLRFCLMKICLILL